MQSARAIRTHEPLPIKESASSCAIVPEPSTVQLSITQACQLSGRGGGDRAATKPLSSAFTPFQRTGGALVEPPATHPAPTLRDARGSATAAAAARDVRR